MATLHITAKPKPDQAEETEPRQELSGHVGAVVGPVPDGKAACRQCGVAVPLADVEPDSVIELCAPGITHHRQVQGASGSDVLVNVGPKLTYRLTGCADCTAGRYPAPLTVELIHGRGLSFQAWQGRAEADTDFWARRMAAATGQPDPAELEVQGRAAACAALPWSFLLREQIDAIRRQEADAKDAEAGVRRSVRVADVAPALLAALPTFQQSVSTGCGLCGLSSMSVPPGMPDSRVWLAHWANVVDWVPELPGVTLPPGSQAGYLGLVFCNLCAPVTDSREHPGPWAWVAGVAPEECTADLGDVTFSKGSLLLGTFATRVLLARALGRPEPEPSRARWAHLRDTSGAWVKFSAPDALLESLARSEQSLRDSESAAKQKAQRETEVRSAVDSALKSAKSAEQVATATKQMQAIRDRAAAKNAASAAQSRTAAAAKPKASKPTATPTKAPTTDPRLTAARRTPPGKTTRF